MPRASLAALALLALACQSAPRQDQATNSSSTPSTADTAAAAAGIDSLRARFFDAYNRDDPKGIAETYSENVNFIIDGTVIHGRRTIEKDWSEQVKVLNGLKFTPVERIISGDLAIVTEKFQQEYHMPNGKTVMDTGYYIAAVRRESDGQWRWQTLMLSRSPEKK